MAVLVTELANGVLQPAVSLGAWRLGEADEVTTTAVVEALKAGYRGLDDAWVYKNESVIGPLIAAHEHSSDCTMPAESISVAEHSFKIVSDDEFATNLRHEPREAHIEPTRSIFVTTKIWVDAFTREGIIQQVEEHLSHFKRTSVDLLLFHWPGPSFRFLASSFTETETKDHAANEKRRLECWRVFEELLAQGRVRAIGVANYSVKHLAPLVKDIQRRLAVDSKEWPKTINHLHQEVSVAPTMPMVNQIEISAFLAPPAALIDLCGSIYCRITSYSSLGSSKGITGFTENETIKSVAARHHVAPSLVLLRWCLEKGFCILPRSTKPERVRLNFNVQTFALTKDDMAAMESLNTNQRQGFDPDEIE